jgi:hypothetical protein
MLFAALCSTLSSTSHVLLSRVPLPLPLVGAVFAGMFLIAFATGRRARGFWAIAALLVPLELAADTLFTTGQRTCYGPAGGPITGPLRSFGAGMVCGGGRVGGSLTEPGTMLADPTVPWLLLAAHLAVGLLASWWLRRGEAALQQTLRAAATLTFRPLARAVAVLRACAAAGPVPDRPRAPTADPRPRNRCCTPSYGVVRR